MPLPSRSPRLRISRTSRTLQQPRFAPALRPVAQWLSLGLLLAGLVSPALAAGPQAVDQQAAAAQAAERQAASAAQELRVPHRVKAPFPALTLPDRVSSGQRALELLGSRLPEVAAWHGRSPDQFRDQMLRDRSWRLDQRGRVFIVEELLAPFAEAPAAVSSSAVNTGALAPLDQTFLLHSKPGALRTIYLNFRGATLNNTAWNGNVTNLVAQPFDLDNIPGTFNTTELERIQYIWQRVAEDYAPFDVNVTTEAVPAADISRSSETDTRFGTTVLITKNTGLYNCNCGGVAYLGVFDSTDDYYKPALVFYDRLGAGSEKSVAEAISHEVGHNMGLGHDGTATTGYYGGHGSGATGWAPLMGVGYYQALSQWSKGEYSGADNREDDYSVMQSNGLPLRTDDHGNTPAAATTLTGSASGGLTRFTATGVIERPADIDMFSFSAGAGAATFNVSPAARAANLDTLITLRNSAGAVLQTANPVDAITSSVSVTLPAAGIYYLTVQGTGKGDPLTTGYSNYGSLGNYSLTGTVTSPGSVPPRAVISASTLSGTAPLTVNFSGAGSTDADGTVASWAWAFGDGGTATGASTSHTFTAPGSYSTVLRVTDNSGISASTNVTVTVNPVVATSTMRVADIGMSRVVLSTGLVHAIASVKVVDGQGAVVPGAVIKGRWSGLVTRNSELPTNSRGLANFHSPSTASTSGNFTFTITGITRTGTTYLPATNTETSDTIAR